MAITKSEKYVDFANKCLWLANQSTGEGLRTILRQMASEWINLAEAELAKHLRSDGGLR